MARSSTTAAPKRPAPESTPPAAAKATAPVDQVLAFKRLTDELEEARAIIAQLRAELARVGKVPHTPEQPTPTPSRAAPPSASESPPPAPAPEKRPGWREWLSKDV